VKHKFTI